MILLTLLILIVLLIVLFILSHLRPLTTNEILLLAKKLRKKKINDYFVFYLDESSPDNEFKKRLNPNGHLYKISENLFNFPSFSASLLKYKKHEWILIGFEKNKYVQSLWVNKGFREGVSSVLNVEQIANIGIRNEDTSILIFHNHPNSNPNQFDCRKPSQQDLITAMDFAEILNFKGLNLIEFVCERGKHYEYFRSPSDNFYPLNDIVEEISKINGKSKNQNLKLHLQRIF